MDIAKIKNHFNSTWNLAQTLDTYQGFILALGSNAFNKDLTKTDLEYSTYYIDKGLIAKCWQYQFGYNIPLTENEVQFQIFYWKPIADINFNGIKWKDNKTLPTNNSSVIGWIQQSKPILYSSSKEYSHFKEVSLNSVQARLHFGYFKKGWIFNKLTYPGIYENIGWERIFRWCYVDELFENDKNEDARNLDLNPNNCINTQAFRK